jgi:hypothetical protein
MGHRNLLRTPTSQSTVTFKESLIEPPIHVGLNTARLDRHCSKARQGAVIGCG